MSDSLVDLPNGWTRSSDLEDEFGASDTLDGAFNESGHVAVLVHERDEGEHKFTTSLAIRGVTHGIAIISIRASNDIEAIRKQAQFQIRLGEVLDSIIKLMD